MPEDNIVGTRFLINVLFSALALAALLFAGWLGYLSLSLRYQVRDWEQRIKDNRAAVRDIQRTGPVLLSGRGQGGGLQVGVDSGSLRGLEHPLGQHDHGEVTRRIEEE